MKTSKVWRVRFCAAAVLAGALTGCAEEDAATFVNPRAIAADHHMHLHSAEIGEAIGAICGTLASCDPEELAAPVGAADAIALLDADDVGYGAILSLGYFAGLPELRLDPVRQQALTRSENEFVAQEIKEYRGRLVGFFSVNPLAAFAADEARYWAQDGRLSGLKLHLANSDVSLRDPDHLAKLAALFEILQEYRLPAIVHMRTRNADYSYDDASAFIDHVLTRAPDVHVTFAHFGGWGSYDEGTDEAVRAIEEALAAGALRRAQISLDLTAVAVPNLPEEEGARLLARMRSIGFDVLLFGTDWAPPLTDFRPASSMERLEALGLTEAESGQIRRNKAPYFK